jgi:hypothetical protein
VLPTGAFGAQDVCRFFSATFAPKSSHLYASLQSECDSLTTANVWTFEGLVFALQLRSPLGVCPTGTNPLFREYNNGQAPRPTIATSVASGAGAARVGRGGQRHAAAGVRVRTVVSGSAAISICTLLSLPDATPAIRLTDGVVNARLEVLSLPE